MTEEEILQELNNRNLIPNTSTNSRDQIINELKSRDLFKQTEDGKFLPTPKQQTMQEGAFGRSIDDTEIPEPYTRSQAVEDYLTSREFSRLALEITGGVLGAAFPPAAIVGRAALLVRPALQQAAKRMMGAGVGEMVGASVSQTFDPSFNSQDDFSEIANDILFAVEERKIFLLRTVLSVALVILIYSV